MSAAPRHEIQVTYRGASPQIRGTSSSPPPIIMPGQLLSSFPPLSCFPTPSPVLIPVAFRGDDQRCGRSKQADRKHKKKERPPRHPQPTYGSRGRPRAPHPPSPPSAPQPNLAPPPDPANLPQQQNHAASLSNDDLLATTTSTTTTPTSIPAANNTNNNVEGNASSTPQQRQASSAVFRFLGKGRLGHQHNMRRFVGCLLHLAETQRGRDVELLEQLGDSKSGKGLELLREICLHNSIRLVAGSDPMNCSFLNVIVPLLRYLSLPGVRNSVMRQFLLPVYTEMSSDTFLQSVSRCLKEMVLRGRFVPDAGYERPGSATESLPAFWTPSSTLEIIAPIAQFLLRLLQLFQEKSSDPTILNCIASVKALTEALPEREPSSSSDKGINSDLHQSLDYLLRMTTRKASIVHEKPLGLLASTTTLQTIVPVIEDKSCPGEICADGPRHDNDHMDISHIQVAPTPEEIICRRNSWLPRNNHKGFHFLPAGTVERHLDTLFRLQRQDMIQPLISGIQSLVFSNQTIVQPNGFELATRVLSGQAIKATCDEMGDIFIYRHVQPEQILESSRSFATGISFLVSFDQLPWLEKGSKQQREAFWDRSKRLQSGSLAILWAVDHSVSKGVAQPIVQPCIVARRRNEEMIHDRPMIGITPCKGHSPVGIQQILSQPSELVLLTTNSGYFAAYGPILEALKETFLERSLPLHQFLIGHGALNDGVQPPRYLSGQQLEWASLCTQKDVRSLKASVLDFPIQVLRENSTLDASQLNALQGCLTRELALVQGPPGTGKTYLGIALMSLLIANRPIVPLPILCVCYTNHALDQFLLGLLNNKVTGIVRCGGQSRSSALDHYNLHEIVKMQRSDINKRHSRYQYAMATKELKEINEQLAELVKELNKISPNDNNPDWKIIRNLLPPKYLPQFDLSVNNSHEVHSESSDEYDIPQAQDNDDGSWEVQDSEKPSSKWKRWMKGGTSAHKAQSILWDSWGTDIWSWSLEKRREKVHQWIEEHQSSLRMEFESLSKRYTSVATQRRELEEQDMLAILKDATVVGMTTTGAAKNQQLIRALAPKIVVCEEAGEVLESHILSCLCSDTRHIILIGDHQQLRPKCELYTLTMDSKQGYNLDMSLFERLVVVEKTVPHVSLQIQRRMLPSIADLIRGTLYPHLQDHDTCAAYPPVAGLASPLWFFTHTHNEDKSKGDEGGLHSHSNAYEVAMAIGLARYLLQQGSYAKDEITILTPYIGQLLLLRDALTRCNTRVVIGDRDAQLLEEKEDSISLDRLRPQAAVTSVPLKGQVRLVSVDNFQGEESSVVIVSLVRSNPQNMIGFLNSSNRTNVLLSRAKHGLYLIGNSSCIRQSRNQMWGSILDILEKKGAIGNYLPLKCARHPETISKIFSPEEFTSKVYDGGCALVCNARLPCGHTCERRCHPNMKEHQLQACLKPCIRIPKHCPFQHPCMKLCCDKCDPCNTEVKDAKLPCGHLATIKCYQVHNLGQIACDAKVSLTFTLCGHSLTTTCHESRSSQLKCVDTCGVALECGHACSNPCTTCQEKSASVPPPSVHGPCTQLCGRALFCGHKCTSPCHPPTKSCPPCVARCSMKCVHSECKGNCNEACSLCAECCTWSCEHQGPCPLPCGAPCTRLPCNERCNKKLGCGHQCPSVCGEPCPNKEYCPICGTQNNRDRVVDFISFTTLQEHFETPSVEPVVVLACGHVYTVSTLDNIFELSRYYQSTVSPDSTLPLFTGLLPLYSSSSIAVDPESTPKEMAVVKGCPECRLPIIGVYRYGRPLNFALLASVQRKFLQQQLTLLFNIAEAISTLSSDTKPLHQLKEAYSLSSKCRVAALKATPPSVLMYNATQAALKRQHALNADAAAKLKAATPTPISALVNDMPSPDTRTKCLACAYYAEVVSLAANALLVLPAEELSPTKSISVTVGDKTKTLTTGGLPNLQKEFNEASSMALDALADALAHKSLKTASEVARALCRLHHAQARVIDKSQGNPKERDQVIKVALDAIGRVFACGIDDPDLRQLEVVLKKYGEGLTVEEKRAIFSAMKLSAATGSYGGHWYQCSNGHIYTIGECGGAMETSTCPECGEQIGGGHHHLVGTSQVASSFLQEIGSTE
ncbi:nf-x1 finger and helicase domain protein [Pelomyxa schiedti]|nr:nf-x1 finger and helicase domain protein [Pelomyxa schiedti]